MEEPLGLPVLQVPREYHLVGGTRPLFPPGVEQMSGVSCPSPWPSHVTWDCTVLPPT